MLKANRVMTKRLLFMLLLVLCVLQAVAAGVANSGDSPFVVGIPPAGSVGAHYTDNGDGTISDKTTGLTWQKWENSSAYNWYQASGTYDATYNPSSQSVCGSLRLAGGGWRLPTMEELFGLVDDRFKPSINTTYFPNAYDHYWSSTTYALITNGAWLVYFGYGNLYDSGKSSSNYVRCVRGGQ